MSFTPPAGNNVALVFVGSYSTPAGNSVTLNLDLALIPSFTATVAETLDDVAGAIAVIASASVTVTASLDDVVGVAAVIYACPISVAAVLDNVAGIIPVVAGVTVTVSGTLDDVVGAMIVNWSSGVWRGIEVISDSIYKESPALDDETSVGFLQGANQYQTVVGSINPGLMVASEGNDGWSNVAPKLAALSVAWVLGDQQLHQSVSDYNASPPKHLFDNSGWAWVDRLANVFTSTYIAPGRKPLEYNNRFAVGLISHQAWLSRFGLANNISHQESLLWDQGNPHSWIWSIARVAPAAPFPPYIPSIILAFYQAELHYSGGAILQFGYPCFAWPLHNQSGTTTKNGVTIVIHTLNVTRLSDMANVPTLSATLQFDIDSWAWGVSLNLKTPQAMALLKSDVTGEPIQVQIDLDGIYITAMIEAWGESRQFGQTAYTASGRSTLALFAWPFSSLRSYTELSTKTASQLIDYELLYTGWSASYDASLSQLFTTDWLVNAGTWSYQNKSRIEAIVQIANAVGARAYADKSVSLVHISPRYPISPWNWASATPDKTIPLSLVRSIKAQLNPLPLFNQVFVSGQAQGVLVSASRSGTAGDYAAPMVTDSLITYVDAGQERARNILSNTGRQSRVMLDLPLNATIGLLEPGQLIEVSDTISWRGLVTGINVNASFGAVSQQVEIERHFQ